MKKIQLISKLFIITTLINLFSCGNNENKEDETKNLFFEILEIGGFDLSRKHSGYALVGTLDGKATLDIKDKNILGINYSVAGNEAYEQGRLVNFSTYTNTYDDKILSISSGWDNLDAGKGYVNLILNGNILALAVFNNEGGWHYEFRKNIDGEQHGKISLLLEDKEWIKDSNLKLAPLTENDYGDALEYEEDMAYIKYDNSEGRLVRGLDQKGSNVLIKLNNKKVNLELHSYSTKTNEKDSLIGISVNFINDSLRLTFHAENFGECDYYFGEDMGLQNVSGYITLENIINKRYNNIKNINGKHNVYVPKECFNKDVSNSFSARD
jgi:hypothetical protein